MTLPWEGVSLAPRNWPGQARVLTLAATLRLMFSREFEVVLRPDEGKRTRVKYVDLPLDKQVRYYSRFKEYYDYIIQETLK